MNRPVNLQRKLSEQSFNYGYSIQLEEVFIFNDFGAGFWVLWGLLRCDDLDKQGNSLGMQGARRYEVGGNR